MKRWENLSDPIFHYAASRGDAVALADGDETLTYAALAPLVAGASVYLRELGIAQGDRIGIALTSSADHVILLLAVLRVGATPIELSIEDTPETLAAIARKYNVRKIFTAARTPQPPGVARIRVDPGWRGVIAARIGDHRVLASADALEIVSLTTGSTGVPSGVIWTHRQHMQHIALRLVIYYGQPQAGFQPADLLLTGSMHHGWFFIGALMQLSCGGRLVLVPESITAADLVRIIAAAGPALACVTANLCRAFLGAVPDRGLLFPRLRLLESAALPLFGEEKRAILSRVAANFLETYGDAGIGTISLLRSAAMPYKPDSVGLPLPTVQVEIVDDNGAALPRGMFGKIRCRSALMPRGCPEDAGDRGAEYRGSAAYISDGWYYPGDIGALDPEGYLHLRGRAADVTR
ncbi:MAG TPA: class I adenylate-forming enzyme family protein [Stellaceae bacterium]|nr:class I adenylate-forming enzyme family protein [Stellaceae bacterium]